MASSIPLRILTARDLQTEAILVPAFTLINDSYNERQDLAEGSLPRYPSPESFLQDLGPDGLCAIVQDTGSHNIPVAVVIAKRWKGRSDLDNSDDGTCREYEIGPAASRNGSEYRGRGLISRCLQAISSRLLSQVEGPVCLWVKVVEETYGSYWARRGFVQYGERYVIPVGEWHRSRAYTLVDMKKDVEREGVTEGMGR